MHKSLSVATLASPFQASAFFDAQQSCAGPSAAHERLFRSATLSDQHGLDEGANQQQQGRAHRQFQWDAQASSAHAPAQGTGLLNASQVGVRRAGAAVH